MFPADFFPKDYFPDPYFAGNGGVVPPVIDTSGFDVADSQRAPVVFAGLSSPVTYDRSRNRIFYDQQRGPTVYGGQTAPVIYHRGK